jgi:hypothetical protein
MIDPEILKRLDEAAVKSRCSRGSAIEIAVLYWLKQVDQSETL